jgi:hypothetical protein
LVRGGRRSIFLMLWDHIGRVLSDCQMKHEIIK